MKTELVRIGNSRGIRIPKPIIEQCGLSDSVDLRVKNRELVISANRRPRRGWDEAFRAARAAKAEPLLLGSLPNKFDHEEWSW